MFGFYFQFLPQMSLVHVPAEELVVLCVYAREGAVVGPVRACRVPASLPTRALHHNRVAPGTRVRPGGRVGPETVVGEREEREGAVGNSWGGVELPQEDVSEFASRAVTSTWRSVREVDL